MRTTPCWALPLIAAAATLALTAQSAPVTQDGPGSGLAPLPSGLPTSAPGSTGPGTVRPAGATASQPVPTSPNGMGPTPDSATGALLEDLRQRAGIPPPGAAIPASAPVARRGAAPPVQNGQPDPLGDLDPELKEALKEARDLVKEGLSGVTGQEGGLTPPGQGPAGGLAGRGSANPSADEEGANNDPAVRRAELAVAQPDAPPRATEPTGPMTLIPDLIQAVRDLLLHPATWLALTLVVLLKLAWAVAAVRSRRRVHRRRHSRRSPNVDPDPSARADSGPTAPPASAPLSMDRPRRSTRDGQRQRRQQR